MAFVFDESKEYLVNDGVNVMAFSDFYPEGHQSGVSLIMHGKRIATNGDIRFEQTPGQWQPVPKKIGRTIDEAENKITTSLAFPDESRHKKGFNPMLYPDFEFNYEVTVKAAGDSVKINVDMDRPVKEEFAGKLCFNLELFPGLLFDKAYLMDDEAGIFPRQANGPTMSQKSNFELTGDFPEHPELKMFPVNRSKGYNPIIADDIIAEPYAVGKSFTVCPDDDYLRFTVESDKNEIKLFDGRVNHNNGWFVISSEIPSGETKGVIQWTITPNSVEGFLSEPVVQISQVGYHPLQNKTAVVELDKKDSKFLNALLYKLTKNGTEPVKELPLKEFGMFLRYRYLHFDFSDIKEAGLYKVVYGTTESSVFKISEDVYERGVWQPVIEYFLPIQMCHMRVNEKYRVWHDCCHMDDGVMAPVNLQNFDGYPQYGSTLCNHKPGDRVHGVNRGGWHDAGDFDLRIESQSTDSYNLALAATEFGAYMDYNTVDQEKHIVEIHQPDGKNDVLEQLEHGILAVVTPYRALGRLARGIICRDLRQYVLLGDAAAMTDNVESDDDRLVFTEDNPARELTVASQLAAASTALKGYNDELSAECLAISTSLYEITSLEEDFIVPPEFDTPVDQNRSREAAMNAKLRAAVELYLVTKEQKYLDYIVNKTDYLSKHVKEIGWILGRLSERRKITEISVLFETLKPAYEEFYMTSVVEPGKESPYGIPYKPYIWGAGWGIQRFGAQYYFLNKAYPDIFDPKYLHDSLHFVLGCHPGSNTASFASGIGTKSVTTAYCAYRQDWSYIPGGVVSGTALIRPDFPELLEFPYLWQQTEYVIGGGSSDYLILVLAARKLLGL
ncbi:MAG: glycoside hydrolase family 9 protein [Lachnospiraceae bacterium]|nr:glycoside hydrolase family 9 protein [Lachnospiraceae bacterium]